MDRWRGRRRNEEASNESKRIEEKQEREMMMMPGDSCIHKQLVKCSEYIFRERSRETLVVVVCPNRTYLTVDIWPGRDRRRLKFQKLLHGRTDRQGNERCSLLLLSHHR